MGSSLICGATIAVALFMASSETASGVMPKATNPGLRGTRSLPNATMDTTQPLPNVAMVKGVLDHGNTSVASGSIDNVSADNVAVVIGLFGDLNRSASRLPWVNDSVMSHRDILVSNVTGEPELVASGCRYWWGSGYLSRGECSTKCHGAGWRGWCFSGFLSGRQSGTCGCFNNCASFRVQGGGRTNTCR